MEKMIQGTGEGVKSLYEALGGLQSKITDLETFERRNLFREDWRGWQNDPNCSCTRCLNFCE